MADYETILTERVGNVLKITLNRPERLNAASIQLAEELSAALYDLDDARAVVITGAADAQVPAGADLYQKPFDTKALVDRLEQLFVRASPA